MDDFARAAALLERASKNLTEAITVIPKASMPEGIERNIQRALDASAQAAMLCRHLSRSLAVEGGDTGR